MSNQKPSAWQQCKQIAETLAPIQSEDPQQAVQRLRAALLAQLAATGEHGAVMAARLKNTDGPISMEPGDMEALEEMRKRFAEKTGIKDLDGRTAIDISLLE